MPGAVSSCREFDGLPLDLRASFERIVKRFPNRRVAMIHGRMTPGDKDATMQRFKNGEIDILEDANAVSQHSGTLHCGTDPGGPCNETTGLSSGLPGVTPSRF